MYTTFSASLLPLLVVEVTVATDDVRAARAVVDMDVNLRLDLVVHACRLLRLRAYQSANSRRIQSHSRRNAKVSACGLVLRAHQCERLSTPYVRERCIPFLFFRPSRSCSA